MKENLRINNQLKENPNPFLVFEGIAVMILLFIGLAIGVLVLSFVMFGLLARNWNW